MRKYLSIFYNEIKDQVKLFFRYLHYPASTSISILTDKLDLWIPPDIEKCYHEVSFLASHNAFANTKSGYFIDPQQIWNIEDQLKRGVRCFLVDFHIDKKDSNLKLCHESCDTTRLLTLGLSQPRIVLDFLQMLKIWMDLNPSEIITLSIENHTDGDTTFDVLYDSNILDLVLTPRELKDHGLHPDDNDGKWPTLKWMIEHNKRLIIFDSVDNTNRYSFNVWQYLIRNMYGTLDLNKAAEVRGSVPDPKPRLFELNFFGTLNTSTFLCFSNSPLILADLFEKVKEKGYLRENQIPNFVALDNVDASNAMKLVNTFNS